MAKGKKQYKCSKCGERHFPPTGKQCPTYLQAQREQQAPPHESPRSDIQMNQPQAETQQRGSIGSPGSYEVQLQKLIESTEAEDQSAPSRSGYRPDKRKQTDSEPTGTPSQYHSSGTFTESHMGGRGATKQKDCFVDSRDGIRRSGYGAPQMPPEDRRSDVQDEILKELKRVNRRLDMVEQQASGSSRHTGGARPKQPSGKQKLSRTFYGTRYADIADSEDSLSDSSSDDQMSLHSLKCDTDIQARVDQRLAALEKKAKHTGKDSKKLKSLRGGDVDVVVKTRVAWPQETILSGPNRNRISYDQLSLPQFVQGFVRNMLDEKNHSTRERMLTYLGDLMEDTTDFSWQNAKGSHAVLLCDMERGNLTWHDTDRIDRIRRAHAQRHTTRQNYSRNSDVGRKPWFCKAFQGGTCSYNKDHDQNGKLQRHICAHCLSHGKTLNHADKHCFAKRNMSKNE